MPHSLTVACNYSSSHYPPLNSITPVLANLSLIPNKYHIFINPPLRRVYLGDRVDDSKTVIDDLKSKIVSLEAHVETLKSSNESTERAWLALEKNHKVIMEAYLAFASLALDKANKDTQLALDKAKDDLRLANLNLEECRAENIALRSRWVTHSFLRQSRIRLSCARVIKSRSLGNTSGQSALNTLWKGTSPQCSNRTIKPLPTRVQLSPANRSFGCFGLPNDMRLISAAQEALAVLSSSSTPPSFASAPSVTLAQSGSSTMSTGSNMPSHATNRVTEATTLAGESSATSNTPILDRSPTPPLLYPPSSAIF